MTTLLTLLVAVASTLGSGVAAGEGYHLLQKVQVTPGDGIFDYAAAPWWAPFSLLLCRH